MEPSSSDTTAPNPASAKAIAPNAQADAGTTPEPVAIPCAIDLEPEDWFWATWRPRVPLPRPEPTPFDFEECLGRFMDLAPNSPGPTGNNWPWNWKWNRLRIPCIMTYEEAHFWFVALTEASSQKISPVKFARTTLRERRGEFGKSIALEDAVKQIAAASDVPNLFRAVLVNLFSLRDWITLARESQNLDRNTRVALGYAFLDGFRLCVLPYLTDEEYGGLRHDLETMPEMSWLPPNHLAPFPFRVHLGAALGLHEQTARIVGSIPNDRYRSDDDKDRDDPQRPQLLVLGLGDPRSVQLEMRRLGLVLTTTDHIRGWLAHTEDSALDYVRDGIRTLTDKVECAAALKVLALVKSPKAAPLMLELLMSSKAPAVARRWLDENPSHAIPALIPVAEGKGKLADAARDYLRSQERKEEEGSYRRRPDRLPPRLRKGAGARSSSAARKPSPYWTTRPLRAGCDRRWTARRRSSRPAGSGRSTCRRSSSTDGSSTRGRPGPCWPLSPGAHSIYPSRSWPR